MNSSQRNRARISPEDVRATKTFKSQSRVLQRLLVRWSNVVDISHHVLLIDNIGLEKWEAKHAYVVSPVNKDIILELYKKENSDV